MKKLLFLLCCVLLVLLASTAPALASYPASDWKTETAYVHIWFGGYPDVPVLWTEFDSLDPDTAIWTWHWDGEAIPANYDVCLAMFMDLGAPRGQVANLRNNLSAAFTMDGPDARMPLVLGAKSARRFWNPVEVAWLEEPQFNKENGIHWVISWTRNLGRLEPGTYSGEATWSMKHKFVGFGIPDPLPDGPLKPTHWDWRGTYPAPFAFTVDE